MASLQRSQLLLEVLYLLLWRMPTLEEIEFVEQDAALNVLDVEVGCRGQVEVPMPGQQHLHSVASGALGELHRFEQQQRDPRHLPIGRLLPLCIPGCAQQQ